MKLIQNLFTELSSVKLAAHHLLAKRPAADVCVVPVWHKEKPAVALSLKEIDGSVEEALKSGDFKGKEGETLLLYPKSKSEKRLLLLGLGDPDHTTLEKIRRSYASLGKLALQKKLTHINLLVPEVKTLSAEEVVRGVTEGVFLANYSFDQLKNHKKQKDPVKRIEELCYFGIDRALLKVAEEYLTICSGVNFSRNLINGNAHEVTPEFLGNVAHEIAKKCAHVKAHVWDKKHIEKEGLGLLLAVNAGSHLEPAFIILEYKGAPKQKDHTVIVGKGVTFDTGGLNLKPTGSMETMKADMSGASIALATILTAATLKLKVNVTAVVPSTDNAIGSKSFIPGDVYKSYSGKTVEIGNTDAEGRLILVDALAYAEKNLKPSRMIDLATLTGAMSIALGSEVAGLFSTDDKLASQLENAGKVTHDRLWRLPMLEEYRELLKSDIADISNVGGRPAGSISAAWFLKEFVEKTPWAHIDIAGVSFLSEAKRYYTKHASGYGVRLLIEFLEGLQ